MANNRVSGIPIDLFATPIADLIELARGAGANVDCAWLVGGAVRDLALGTPAHELRDLDITVEGDAIEFARALGNATGADVTVHESFGTASVVVLAGAWAVHIDAAMARSELYETPGSLPIVELSPLAVDLQRRDFTIHTLALSLGATGAQDPVDLHGGLDDLEHGRLRVLHDRSFIDDPTRILRAARYAARLGYELEPHTLGLAQAAVAAGALATVSPERIGSELRLLCSEPIGPALPTLSTLGVFEALALQPPDARAAARVDVVASQRSDSETANRMRLALLLSSLAPDAAGDWAARHGIEGVGAAAVQRALSAAAELDAGPLTDDLAVLHTQLARYDGDALLVASAVTSHAPSRVSIMRYLQARARAELHLDGHDVLELGVPAGPAVGRILDQIYSRAVAGELPDAEAQRDAARELAAQEGTQ